MEEALALIFFHQIDATNSSNKTIHYERYRNLETLMSMYLGKAGVSDQSLIVLYTMLDAFEHWIAANFPKAYNALENCKTLKRWISSQKHAE